MQSNTAEQFKLTRFGLALATAEAKKKQAWADYQPLTRAQLWDDLKGNTVLDMPNEATVTIKTLTPPENASTRSTLGSPRPVAVLTTVKRPTEAMAIRHAQGFYVLDTDMVFERQAPELAQWYCVQCKHFKPLPNFARDNRYPAGIAFWCNECRHDYERGVWRDPAKTAGVLTIGKTA